MKKSKSTRKRTGFLLAGAVLSPVCTSLASLLGSQLFPTNNPWYQNISTAPVATNSAAIIANIGPLIKVRPDWDADSVANGTNTLYGIPFNVVHGNSTAKVNVIIDDYPEESDLVPVPIPANAVIEGDYQNGPNLYGPGPFGRNDSHLLVWDIDNNFGYELFSASRPTDLNSTDHKWHAASETFWNFNTNHFRPLGYTSADGAGLPILTGLARPDEGLPVAQGGQGVINHALRVTLPSSAIDAHYIYPASHRMTSSSASNRIPAGGRLRLQNTPAVNNRIALMGPQSQILARAMQQYGLIVADIGSAMFVTGASGSVDAGNHLSLVWDMTDVGKLRGLTAGDFEVVNLTPVVTGLGAAQGSLGSTLTISGQNFSGAIGHLSVFFGNTNTTAVTVLSDTQLTVVVPPGNGTVDVKVQSGVTNTALGGNLTTPIFGYGTSALSTADRFTFVPPTPTIQQATLLNGSLILQGTNNSGAGGTYHVLTATNLSFARTTWSLFTNGTFDSKGNFSLTNSLGNIPWRFFSLQVP